jgi:hypothetical protein
MTPGWVIAIITALVATLATSFATFWVGYLLDVYKRRRDVGALAETFIAEIGCILQLFDELRIEERCRGLRVVLLTLDPSTSIPRALEDGLTFPITVYEKCADRVGSLGREVAGDIVRFYNFTNGFRTCVRIAVGSGPITGRIETIDFMLTTLRTERPNAEALLQRLRAIAHRHH